MNGINRDIKIVITTILVELMLVVFNFNVYIAEMYSLGKTVEDAIPYSIYLIILILIWLWRTREKEAIKKEDLPPSLMRPTPVYYDEDDEDNENIDFNENDDYSQHIR